MGRELQKKKNRSGNPKVRQKPKSKKINVKGNAIIAANWRQSETLSQNYRRLGLTSRLNASTGGIEKLPGKFTGSHAAVTPLAITSTAAPTSIIPSEAKVERDPSTGKILRVIHSDASKKVVEHNGKTLNDPLNSDGEDDEEWQGLGEHANDGFDGHERSENEIVRQLEEQASRAAPKVPRKQSEREKEWCQRLVEAYGEDYGRMARDRRLNPMQQTEADIRRRVTRWREDGGGQAVEA